MLFLSNTMYEIVININPSGVRTTLEVPSSMETWITLDIGLILFDDTEETPKVHNQVKP